MTRDDDTNEEGIRPLGDDVFPGYPGFPQKIREYEHFVTRGWHATTRPDLFEVVCSLKDEVRKLKKTVSALDVHVERIYQKLKGAKSS